MKTPNKNRQGNIMLHICSFNDHPFDKWIDYFREGELKWLLETEEGQDCLDKNPLESIQIENSIKEHLYGSTEAPECNSEAINKESSQTVQVSEEKPVKRHSEPVEHTINVFAIMTDKGEFYNVKLLKSRLEPLYRIDDFDKVFDQGLIDIDIDPSVDYISTTKRKALIKKLKTLVKEYLDNITEEVCNDK